MPKIIIPSEFCCPITLALFKVPVQTSDGYVFEQTAIATWLKQHNRSPITNLPLINKSLTPAPSMQAEVQAFLNAEQICSEEEFLSVFKQGDAEAFKKLNYIERYFHLTIKCESKERPNASILLSLFESALLKQAWPMLEFLLQETAHAPDLQEVKKDCVSLAIKQGDSEALRLLLQAHIKPHSQNKIAYLFRSVLDNRDMLRLQLLLQAGVDLTIDLECKTTPLHYASQIGWEEGVVLLLAQASINIEAQTKRGKTALFVAVEYNKPLCVEKLLLAGADPDVRETEYMHTPLIYAAREGYAECLHLLLKAKANYKMMGLYNNTPLHEASRYARSDEKGDCVKYLLQYGADPNAKNQFGSGPLDEAIHSRYPANRVQYLIEYGANVRQLGQQLAAKVAQFATDYYFNPHPDNDIKKRKSPEENDEKSCDLVMKLQKKIAEQEQLINQQSLLLKENQAELQQLRQQLQTLPSADNGEGNEMTAKASLPKMKFF